MNRLSKCRAYADSVGFPVSGKLRRMPNKHYGMDDKHSYPWYIDEAGNEYLLEDDGSACTCIVTADGGII